MPNFSSQVKGKKDLLTNQLTKTQSVESIALGLFAGAIVLIIGGSIVFLSLFKERIFPGIYINNIPVGGKTTQEAINTLTNQLPPLPETVVFTAGETSISSSSSELEVAYNTPVVVREAYEVGRVGFPITRLWLLLKNNWSSTQFTPTITYNQQKVAQAISVLNQQTAIEGHNPSSTLRYTLTPSSVTIDPGAVGTEIDSTDTEQLLQHSLDTIITSGQSTKTLAVPATVVQTTIELTEKEQSLAKERATRLVGRRIIGRAVDVRVELSDVDLINLLQFPEGYDVDKVATLLEDWKTTIERPAQDAQFSYDPNTLVVKEFSPHKQGLALDLESAQSTLLEQLALLEQNLIANETSGSGGSYADTTIDLPITTIEPEITLGETNSLGIAEQIGFGESEYDHSIPSRIHNVALTARKINNFIVAPGKEFSFNKALGEVSAATGYQPAYVIRAGQTVLGDGGGVCQVSTTLFRAVLNAGLEITKRKQHSYRVSYYELNAKPGIDATVYAGDVDFRFVNDTDHHILIHTDADSQDLYMKVELYSTSDGRTAEIVNHEVWDARPALPPQFITDPSLPPGTKKQIDWAVGGIKARFKNVVKGKDGNVIREDEYYSNYVPWAAKYLVGP